MTDATWPAELPLASCSLDAGGLETQLDRYRTLAASVVGRERDPLRLRVEFAPEVDLRLLRTTVAVERGCCDFFAIHVDWPERTLAVAVADAALAPALDAIADLLGAESA